MNCDLECLGRCSWLEIPDMRTVLVGEKRYNVVVICMTLYVIKCCMCTLA